MSKVTNIDVVQKLYNRPTAGGAVGEVIIDYCLNHLGGDVEKLKSIVGVSIKDIEKRKKDRNST